MPPNSNKLWQCGNHIPVHIALSPIQKKYYTNAFDCKKWRSKKLDPVDDENQQFLGVTWKCGNHTNPAHVARTKDEKKNFTKTEKCKNWHTGLID